MFNNRNTHLGQNPASFATFADDFVLVHNAVLKFDIVKINIGNGCDKITGMLSVGMEHTRLQAYYTTSIIRMYL